MIRGQVLGLDELDRALKALPREIAGKNGGPLRVGLRAAARLVRDEARARAPEDTGRLKGAIVMQLDRNPGNVSERIVVRPRRGRSRADTRGAWYWHFLEFGTVKQPAQPYLRPAFDARKFAMIETFKIRMAASIRAAVRRVAKLRAREQGGG